MEFKKEKLLSRLSKDQVIGILNGCILSLVSSEKKSKINFNEDFALSDFLIDYEGDIIELVMELELELDIEIFDEEIPEIKKEIKYYDIIGIILEK